MGARNKLNQAYANGSLLIAAIVGVLFESWTLFWLTLAYCLVSNLSTGDIRGSRPSRKR